MPTPIIFTITTAGRLAALDAFDNGLTIALTQCAFGSGKYTPTGSETVLNTELGRVGLSGGAIESVSATLRFSAALVASTHINAFEIGLFSSTGVLFAVASTTSTTIPLTVVEPNIDTICAFGLVLGDVPASSLTITLDPNAPIAVQLVTQHAAAANPHPQYATDTDLSSEVTSRENADTSLAIALAAEITNRAAADALKANKAGDNTQSFKVGAAAANDDAIRLDQLTSMGGAIKIAILQMIYQVGQPYFNKVDARNPNAIFGVTVGTWAQEKGRFLVGFDDTQTEFDALAETGGAKEHTMNNANMPAHTHKRNADELPEGVNVGTSGTIAGNYSPGSSYIKDYTETGSAGSATPDPIPTTPPYVVYSWWVRTA